MSECRRCAELELLNNELQAENNEVKAAVTRLIRLLAMKRFKWSKEEKK